MPLLDNVITRGAARERHDIADKACEPHPRLALSLAARDDIIYLRGNFCLTRTDFINPDAPCKMKTLHILAATGLALVTLGLSGCETPTQGAGTGAAAGAILGGIAGGNVRSAAIGAGAGALTGAAIGQSNKEQALRNGYYY